MATTLEIDHKEMHDIKSAAEISGYSRDHVTSLARAKKIVAAQVGRQWYVDLDSLDQYVKVTSIEQQVKQKHLSEDRKAARDLSKRLDEQKIRRGVGTAEHKLKIDKAMAGLAVAFLFVAGGLAFTGSLFFDSISPQVATSKLANENPLKNKEVPTPVLYGDEVVTVHTSFSEEGVAVHMLADAEEAVVLLPETALTNTELFSDEVEIATTTDGVRRLVPKGRPAEEGVPFVSVPVREVLTP